MANVPLTSFNSGEMSPKLTDRVDTEKYGSGCKRLDNLIPEKYGCVERRPGTLFIIDITDAP
jgi:hypothetical protein